MSRKPRHLLWSEDACFHIFSRGHNCETVLRDDDRRRFLELCKRYRFALDLDATALGSADFLRRTEQERRRTQSRRAGRPMKTGDA